MSLVTLYARATASGKNFIKLAKIPKILKNPKIPKILKNVQKRSKLDVLTTGANSLQSVHGLLSFVRNVLYSVLSGCGKVRTMVRRKVESFCA